jgi:hypothetical protein
MGIEAYAHRGVEMTQDEIIEMAKQAGFDLNMWQLSLGCEANGTLDELEAFARLVAAKEREECVKVCEKTITSQRSAWGANFCIAAIRARGEQA